MVLLFILHVGFTAHLKLLDGAVDQASLIEKKIASVTHSQDLASDNNFKFWLSIFQKGDLW
mgnify:CR=1 FL=1